MAVRSVLDESGVEWQVWEVRPSPVVRQTPPAGTPQVGSTRPSLAPRLEDGWLTFQAPAGERRRIVPIPTGWEGQNGVGLRRLLQRADVQPRTHRLDASSSSRAGACAALPPSHPGYAGPCGGSADTA
jgi:hypothetical protein